MGYGKMLKIHFSGIKLKIEDLLFLEPFQVEYLPRRLAKEELAILLQTHPLIGRYLASCCPAIERFIGVEINDVSGKTAEERCDEILWEIADLIIYNRYPETYYTEVELGWTLDEIIPPESLANKIIIEAGAGPGKLSLLAASRAGFVFAVEPASGFRRLIREKAAKINNLYAVDGFLSVLPFTDNFADILITSNAIGWSLDDELNEIERVVKPGGRAIHLFRNFDSSRDETAPLHDALTSSIRGYKCTKITSESGIKLKYEKIILCADY